MKTIRNAAEVLRCLSADTPELAVSSVARSLGMPKSSVSRLMGVMRDHGLLEQNPKTRRFFAGPLTLSVGSIYQTRSLIMGQVEQAMVELVDESGFTGYVCTLDGAEVAIVRNHEGSYPVRLVVPAGHRFPAYATAAGKAMLARLSDREIRATCRDGFERIGPGTVASIPDLIADVASIRRRRWADGDETIYAGMGSVAVAIGGHDNRQVVGLSLSYPLAAVTAAARAELVAKLTARAGSIGRRVHDPFWMDPDATRVPQGGGVETTCRRGSQQADSRRADMKSRSTCDAERHPPNRG